VLGGLFQFESSGDTEAEKYLFKTLGKSDRQMNRVIRAVPVLANKIYETARMMADQNLRAMVDEHFTRFGQSDYYRRLDPERLRKLHLEIVNFIFYFVAARIIRTYPDPLHYEALLHGISLGLRKSFYVPEEVFFRYQKLAQEDSDPEKIKGRFSLSLTGYITGKPDVTLASSLKALGGVVEKASDILLEMTIMPPPGQNP
jgi:hypothetical protein